MWVSECEDGEAGLVGTGLAMAGPSFPAVNFCICRSESPRGISRTCPVRLAAWGVGSGRREPGRPVLSRGHLGPKHATSQGSSSPAAPCLPQNVHWPRGRFLGSVSELYAREELWCVGSPVPPQWDTISLEFFKFEGVGSQIHNQVSPT